MENQQQGAPPEFGAIRESLNQPGGPQPLPPDPAQYDFYDPTETARFHQDNSAYMQTQIDARVQAHLAPHQSALQEAELRSQYAAAQARYGDDPDFQSVMDTALRNLQEEQASGRGGKIDIVAAYQKANDASAARPGVRGNAHLPEAFRGKNGISMLGRIMQHNISTGRSGRR